MTQEIISSVLVFSARGVRLHVLYVPGNIEILSVALMHVVM